MPPPSERLRAVVAARALPPQPSPEAAELARALASRGGDAVLGIVFFGSRRTQAGFNPWSAYDFFVLTRDHAGFYRNLAAAGATRRSPRLLALLDAWLPPNQLAVRLPAAAPGSPEPLAKCAVIPLALLEREASEGRRDHFCIGRLFQPTEIVYARDADAKDRLLDALVAAHAATLGWVRPFLPERFDTDEYCRSLLRVSMSWEIRPEPEGRSDALWRAQQADLREAYGVLLRELAAAGELREETPGVYALARPATAAERRSRVRYFRSSRARATARWLKYTLTFEGWLDYIQRKAERHSGQRIELSPRERRWPLVFLWPRLLRYLRQKDRAKGGKP